MKSATVGERYQVVIPKEIRGLLDIKPHSKVVMRVVGETIILTPDLTAEMRGIGKSLPKDGTPEDYVQKLRSEWGNRI
jgi:AbrB family looped-hinge helix DNA binding protein